jgi:hypothetical protein
MVLIAGGCCGGQFGYLASAELYDPATGTFTATGSMTTARAGHTATLLNNGMVLIAGGCCGGQFGYLASAELYDPATGTFTATGSMTTARAGHTATLLNNGMVLIAGGCCGQFGPLASAELYDPATGTFTPTGSMTTARYEDTATLLNNGMVLVAGGDANTGYRLASAELYDPATGTFTPTGNMTTARGAHAATLLNNGMVLIAGGVNGFNGGVVLASAELYDPATGTFTATGSMTTGHYYHTATLLNNGMVLIAGGYNYTTFSASAELYDPATGTFTATGSMTTARPTDTATLLNKGMVLVAGGQIPIDDGGCCLASAELYSPATGIFTTTGSMNTGRAGHTATPLNNGMVLIAGGESPGGILASAELYQPQNTPLGSNVNVPLSGGDTVPGGVAMAFASVTTAGNTTLTTSSSGPTPPGGFGLGSPATYYSLTTTATFTGPITVCINYTGISFTSGPQLFHFDGGSWVDVTVSVDTVNHIICGSVSSLSPFGIFSCSSLPTLSISFSPDVLWPPNNKLVLITATISVTDSCDANPSAALVSITANEPLAPGDIQGARFGTDDRSFELDATRLGSGKGRTYTVTYKVSDHLGHSATASATVTVPHNQ